MGSRDGHIELDYPVESIRVGRRHRRDLGDLDELVASIRDQGMLQPVTVSPEGTLICGVRRLEAVKQLGWRKINVWVRSGISSPMEQLLAERDENTARKPYSPIEAAGLYRELKALIAEDATRRQEATRFGADRDPNGEVEDGAANLAAPHDRTSRAQAARMVTGRKSYTTLERIGELERLATDPDTPERLRHVARDALTGIDTDGKVYGHYRRVKAAQAETNRDPPDIEIDRQAELETLAEQALERVEAASHRQPSSRVARRAPQAPTRRYGVRAFLLTWNELRGWADHYDPAEIGLALTDDQWGDFETTLAATVEFAAHARRARAAGDVPDADDAPAQRLSPAASR